MYMCIEQDYSADDGRVETWPRPHFKQSEEPQPSGMSMIHNTQANKEEVLTQVDPELVERRTSTGFSNDDHGWECAICLSDSNIQSTRRDSGNPAGDPKISPAAEDELCITQPSTPGSFCSEDFRKMEKDATETLFPSRVQQNGQGGEAIMNDINWSEFDRDHNTSPLTDCSKASQR